MNKYLLSIITILLVILLLVKAEDPNTIYYDEDYKEYSNPTLVVEDKEELDISTGDNKTLTCDVNHFKKCLNNNDFYERLYDKGDGYTCDTVVKSRRQFFVMWSQK